MIRIGAASEEASGANVYRAAFAWLANECGENPRLVRELLGTEALIRLAARLLLTKRLALRIEKVDEAVAVSGILKLYLEAEIKARGLSGVTWSEAIDNPRLPAAFTISARYENRAAVYSWQADVITYKINGRNTGKAGAMLEAGEWFDSDANEKDVASLFYEHLKPTR